MRKADRSPLWGNRVERYLRYSLKKITELKELLPSFSAKHTAFATVTLVLCVAVTAVSVISGTKTTAEAADVYIGTDASFEGEAGGIGRFSENTADKASDTENADETEKSPGRYTVTFAFHSRDSISCSVGSAATVGELAERLGITFADTDVLNISEDTVISEDTLVTTDKITHKTDKVHTVIPYTTKYVDDNTMYSGDSKTMQYGQNGETVTEYEVTYVNGEETERTELKSYTAKEPVEQIIHRGTKVYTAPKAETPVVQYGGNGGGTFVGGDGKTYHYTKYIDVRATVYYSGGYCANGMPANESVIAVDPSVIPLGTEVYITGSYADIGVRIAADTGGSIKGNIIDICVDPSNPLAGSFGFRNMRVYFIG